MRTLYNVLFTLAVPLLLARIVWRERHHPAYRRRWHERFSIRLPEAPPAKPVWIHAVSVGETVAATPIVNYLCEHHPTTPILFTTTTVTGAAAASGRFGAAIQHVFFPYDLAKIVSRFVAHFNPRMLILMETELWPNLLKRCRETNIPVMVANARLSHKSAARYRLFPSMTADMLDAIKCFAAQGVEDRKRFIALGAPADAVAMTGSIKFDIELPQSISESGQSRRRFLGVNRAVLMAGSTRDGEEEFLLQGFSELLVSHPDLLLLLAPRHPERCNSVHELCGKRGFNVLRHSSATSCPAQVQVYLVDSMGELPSFYAASDVAFVGGSLVRSGGHNVLEPAALGLPVVVGPHTYNFAEIVEMLQGVGALYVAADIDCLVERVSQWLQSSEERDIAGAAGRRIVQQNKGAAKKIVHLIEQLLSDSAHIDSVSKIESAPS